MGNSSPLPSRASTTSIFVVVVGNEHGIVKIPRVLLPKVQIARRHGPLPASGFRSPGGLEIFEARPLPWFSPSCRKRLRPIVVGAALLTLPAEAQDHRFETDPVVTVRENFVACEVLSQLQRVMENPRFLLASECVPLRAGDRVRVYASRGPYACIYPHDTIVPCKCTHEKALSK
jgi:hypothetical protein